MWLFSNYSEWKLPEKVYLALGLCAATIIVLHLLKRFIQKHCNTSPQKRTLESLWLYVSRSIVISLCLFGWTGFLCIQHQIPRDLSLVVAITVGIGGIVGDWCQATM